MLRIDNLGYIFEQFKNPTDDPKDLPDNRNDIGEGSIVGVP